MRAYVIHFELDSFIAQIPLHDGDGAPIYAAPLLDMQDIHGVPASVTSVLIATYQDRRATIHAARIVVEQASLLGDQGCIAAGVRERATLARDALAARLPGPLAGAALQLCPGLYNDLRRFATAHDLWRWADGPDPRTRRLIPVGALTTAPAPNDE